MFDFHISPEIRREALTTVPQRKLRLGDFQQSSQDRRASGGAELGGDGLLALVLILPYQVLPLK